MLDVFRIVNILFVVLLMGEYIALFRLIRAHGIVYVFAPSPATLVSKLPSGFSYTYPHVRQDAVAASTIGRDAVLDGNSWCGTPWSSMLCPWHDKDVS